MWIYVWICLVVILIFLRHTNNGWIVSYRFSLLDLLWIKQKPKTEWKKNAIWKIHNEKNNWTFFFSLSVLCSLSVNEWWNILLIWVEYACVGYCVLRLNRKPLYAWYSIKHFDILSDDKKNYISEFNTNHSNNTKSMFFSLLCRFVLLLLRLNYEYFIQNKLLHTKCIYNLR